jgi:hypothetical protein
MTTDSVPDFEFCMADARLSESVTVPGSNLISRDGEPSHLAADRSLWWPNGKKLKVRFLNGTPKLQQKVRYYSRTWMEYAHIDFRFVEEGDADIRVSFRWYMPPYPPYGTSARIKSPCLYLTPGPILCIPRRWISVRGLKLASARKSLSRTRANRL